MPDESPDGSRARLEQLIDERINKRFQDIGIFAGNEESLIRTRRNFAKLDRDAQAEEDRGQERRRTAFGVLGDLLTYGVSAAVGGAITWALTALKGH